MKKFYIILASVVLSSSLSKAMTMQEATSQGTTIGNIYKNNAAGVITEQNKLNTPGYQTDNPAETGYYSDSSGLSADARRQRDNSDLGRFIIGNLAGRPQIEIGYNEAFLRTANQITSNPDEILRMMTSNYSDCTVTPASGSSNELFTCVSQRHYQNQLCERVLTVRCSNPNAECDAGNIMLSTVVSDMRWSYAYPNLTIGTAGDNYWSGGRGCNTYDRTTTFTIRDVSEVKTFTLKSVGYDDQIIIKVNGTQVFGNINGCRDLGVNSYASPNVNLIPFLREGVNSIQMIVSVGGRGEGWMTIEARQNCCNNPEDVWTEVCQ